MKKVFYAKIGGKFYPMVFSLGAKKQLGAIKKVIEPFMRFKNTDLSKLDESEQIELLSNMVDYISITSEILIAQGVAYKNRFESNFKTRRNDAVDENGVWQRLKAEDVQLLLEDEEIKPLNDVLIQCLTSESGTINVQIKPSLSKKKAKV